MVLEAITFHRKQCVEQKKHQCKCRLNNSWDSDFFCEGVVMANASQSNIQLVQDYLDALQNGKVGDDLAQFFTADAVQVELPNRLNPKGQTSDLSSILARSIQGKQVLRSQRFEILNIVAQGDRVSVEALWTGIPALTVGALTEGSELRAHFAMFFECEAGRICSQRNYDCFEPW
jgi:ketosteroid isomerase-like protein